MMLSMDQGSLSDNLDSLLEWADSIRFDDPAAMLSAAQRAGGYAEILGDFRRYTRSLVLQATAYGDQHQYEAALTYATEALSLARNYDLAELEALAVGTIAMCFAKCGIADEALHLLKHQLILGEALGSAQIRAMALNDMSAIAIETDTEKGITQLIQALELMPSDIRGGKDRALLELNLSVAYIMTDELQKTIAHAHHVLETLGNAPKIRADAHLFIAACHTRRGEFDAAWERIGQAQKELDSAGIPLSYEKIDYFVAELKDAQGDLAGSIAVWESMYEKAIERQELTYAITALNNLKDLYERIGDTANQIHAYKRLSEEIPAQQRQSSELRLQVLRTVFAQQKAAMEEERRFNQQKNQILERLSHEFRTPLAVIQATSQTLAVYTDKLSLEQRQSRLQRITNQVQRMTVMLDDILEILKIDEGAFSLPGAESFTLTELARASLDHTNRYWMPHERIELQIEGLNSRVRGCYDALQTILVHLLTNAVKFSDDKVILKLAAHDDVLMMQVIDEGIGIPPAERKDIFQPLFRGSNLDEVPGNGLGLAIVARLVTRIKGRIEVDSDLNKGTTMTVRVPVELN